MTVKDSTIHTLLTYFIAFVWLVNGLFCKILNLVPRHEQIVAKILGDQFSRIITIFIGFSEILMVGWILSGFKPKLNAITQMVIVAIMNVLEFFMATDLLLWGRVNSVFALLFVGIIYFNEFVYKGGRNLDASSEII